jgi:hypothetical protein
MPIRVELIDEAVEDRCRHQPFGVGRHRGHHDLQARHVGKPGREVLRVAAVWTVGDAGAKYTLRSGRF